MGFIVKEFEIKDEKVLDFLVKKLGFNVREAKRAIDRGRVSVNDKRITKKSQRATGRLKCIVFEPNGYGLKPIFETTHFAVFDKPSGVAIHPKKLANTKSLLDDVRSLWGNDANLVHRLDKETSGLVMASKNKFSESVLKKAFQDKEIQKKYLALVKGHLEKDLTIKKPIAVNKDENIKVKVMIHPEGKESVTIIKPIKKIGENTLVECIPLTGRQHQIRVHLFSIGHPIVGDPLYGVDNEFADRYLNKLIDEKERIEKTGAKRLMLHAYYLEFMFMNNKYVITSRSFEKELSEN
ncbi:ribosomal large subunit pseudouridine synthase C [Nautilia profundicola AmH]|uniref:RNA pseudouridylate synthase n=1 Tax=Nautilia profundicola (strain ATCC BAA-1463 / DSM 18972 / AmH) TaxID=598659 RepID=B9L6Z5_NAUPA|nr:RluA family pseudouridine synthase [Nautilia profundicola]ACM92939.1 ribosomal large subunit pseudouridine synthase C [Nautilia profundicola AmH]